MKQKRKFQMPSSMVLLFFVLIFVAILTWFIPTSVVTVENGVKTVHFNAAFDADGNVIENAGTSPAGLWDIFMAPILGFIKGADVSASILASGAFLAILNYTGAMDAGIGALLKKYSGKKLLSLLMLVFAIQGTIYGAWEEFPAYALVITPLCVKAGYDVLTAFEVLFIGGIIGNMASVTNPYATGIAVSIINNPDLSLGTGILLRIVLFVLLYVIGTFVVVRYAENVRRNPASSAVYGLDVNTLVSDEREQMPELTKARKRSLIVFAVVVLIIIIGYIPWASIPCGEKTMYEVVNYPQTWLLEHAPRVADFLGVKHFSYWGDWYFNEFSFMMFVGAVIVAFVNKLSLKDFSREFIGGARSLVSITLVVGVSRGVSLMMGSGKSGMSVTFVYWIRNLLAGVPVWLFALAAVVTYCFTSLFVQGTSSTAGITMPILGTVALTLFADSRIGSVGGQTLLISCFTLGLNFTASGLYPEATKMGVLELTNIPYPVYIRHALKSLVPMLLAGTALLMLAPYIGLL
jgi:uncharacterized ion transporter superfamily protein YfcC